MLKTWLSKSPSNTRFIEAAERKKELFEYKKTVETKAKEKMRQAGITLSTTVLTTNQSNI
jgi:hypothetical protein